MRFVHTTSCSVRAIAAAAVGLIALTAIATSANATPLPTVTGSATIQGHVEYNGAPATGGCVRVYDLTFAEIASDCTVVAGDYSITGIAPGNYLVWLEKFDGAANAYWTDGDPFAKTAVLAAGDTLQADVTLAQGGTLIGRLSKDADGYASRKVTLFTTNREFVDQVTTDSDGWYSFSNVPEGDYFVKLEADGTSSSGWIRTTPEGDRLAISIPDAGNQWSVSRSFSFPWFAYGSIVGHLNVPKGFTTTTVCVAAVGVWNQHVFARDCGPVGSEFQLDPFPVDYDYADQPLAIVFVDSPTRVNSWSTAGSHAAYFGNAPTYDEQLEISIPGTHDYYLPVYFFTDVTTRTVGYSNIQWMGDMGLSRGYADGSYRPDSSVIRKHMASFLWNLMGRPDVTLPATSPFIDVQPTDSGYVPMVWMKQEGITTSTQFLPRNAVTRMQMALFLYRLAGSPAVTLPAKSPFKDIKPSDPGYVAMVWMSKAGISSGYGDGTYKPSRAVTRGQMATFMAHFYDNVDFSAGSAAARIGDMRAELN